MNPKKMLLLASVALAAIAVTAPAGAQATVTLTKEGKVLPVGSPVTAKSTNFVVTVGTGGERYTCQEVLLHYTVATNGLTHVVLSPVAAHNGTWSGCQFHIPNPPLTFPTHITQGGAGQLTLNTSGTGEAALTFTANTTALGLHCSYTGNLPLQATNGSDLLDIETNNKLTAMGSNCLPGEAHGSFTVTSNGIPVIVDLT